MNSADLDRALASLPHGPEFRFLTRVTDLTPGQAGKGEYRVPDDAPFLRGHFPGDPIFPGVLLVEAAAQLSGVVAQSDPDTPPLGGLKLAALRNVKFLGSVKPGELIQLEAQITGRLGGIIQARVTARVWGANVLTAELSLSGAE